MKYKSTQFTTVSSIANQPPKVGQWMLLDGAIRAQYLGTTARGDVVLRYQHGKFGKIADAKSNHYLRQFAVINGAA